MKIKEDLNDPKYFDQILAKWTDAIPDFSSTIQRKYSSSDDSSRSKSSFRKVSQSQFSGTSYRSLLRSKLKQKHAVLTFKDRKGMSKKLKTGVSVEMKKRQKIALSSYLAASSET